MKISKSFIPIAFSLAIMPALPVKSHPIDCAILLCMAGGFPASTECADAKIEVIRRITPLPVEPPLQLWRCPMRLDASIAAKIGVSMVLGSDGLNAETRAIRDGIEIYHIQQYRHKRGGDSEYIIDRTTVGKYLQNGHFQWAAASYQHGPAWLAEAAGGYTVARSIGCDDDRRPVYGRTCVPTVISTTNDHNGFIRGVFMRYRDTDGTYHIEAIRY